MGKGRVFEMKWLIATVAAAIVIAGCDQESVCSMKARQAARLCPKICDTDELAFSVVADKACIQKCKLLAQESCNQESK